MIHSLDSAFPEQRQRKGPWNLPDQVERSRQARLAETVEAVSYQSASGAESSIGLQFGVQAELTSFWHCCVGQSSALCRRERASESLELQVTQDAPERNAREQRHIGSAPR